MLKFIRGKSQHTTAERFRLQRELFAFQRTSHYGFPSKPAAIAFDPVLRIMAIGTASGAIRVYGKPGVEFYGQQAASLAINKLMFVPNTGLLVSLCSNSSIHLWEINDLSVSEIAGQLMEGKLRNVSCMCVESSSKYLYIGTESGNVLTMNVDPFELLNDGVYQDSVIQNVPDSCRINPGAVECVAERPGQPHHLLIGYTRGLIVVWNKMSHSVLQCYLNTQQLEDFCWAESGDKFVSCHNDGSYVHWSTDVSEHPVEEAVTVYGPFPCKAITKIVWAKSFLKSQDDMLIFSGGMPRASYSDRHTVSVVRGVQKHVVFEFTSKVVDFVTIQSTNERGGCQALLVLTEEELVAIDLTSDNWCMIPLPYLCSLHASAITCTTYLSDVDEQLWTNIINAGRKQNESIYSHSEWPVDGGVVDETEGGPAISGPFKDLFVTGHEDGSVRLWNAGSTTLSLIYTLRTSSLFSVDNLGGEHDVALNHCDEASTDDEEDWPPFKKVGCFDPFSDDPRLTVRKINICRITGTLAIGGSAGHVILYHLNDTAVSDKELKVTLVNIVGDRGDNFVWKGNKRLPLCGCESVADTASCGTVMSFQSGYQPHCVLQIHPPACITALAFHSEWCLVAAGISHGLVLFDYSREAPVLTRCTLSQNDMVALNEPPISRTKSFKKSLRESFRRIRRGGRSTRSQEKLSSHAKASPTSPSGGATVNSHDGKRRLDRSYDAGGVIDSDTKVVERAIESRSTDDGMGNMVRCLYFANTFIVNAQHLNKTLWVGTNNGTVYIYLINVPLDAKRQDEKVSAVLGKEIQLKHRAPVVSTLIINSGCKPLPDAFEQDKKVKYDACPPHQLIISSEEQFKVFLLPNLKPVCKLKLTATEGAKIRRVTLATFSMQRYSEYDLMCLTNLGECIVLSIPDLRRQITAAITRREDISGMSSLVFTKHGEALYLHSSSELQRITMSLSRRLIPKCHLPLPDIKRRSEIKAASNRKGGKREDKKSPTKKQIEESEIKGAASGTYSQEVEITESELSVVNVSAITVDSVKDHLANLMNAVGSHSATTTTATTTTTTTDEVNKDEETAVVSETVAVTTNENDNPNIPVSAASPVASITED